MKYYGRIFRPPSEARSLIIQATVGCSHNKCRFCDMYKEKSFFIRPLKEILEELKETSFYMPNIEKVFLGDGDALIMKTEDLLEILRAIKKYFKNIKQISVYASPKSILSKSVEELKLLEENGLSLLYLGLESGDDKVLKYMQKGVDSENMIEAARKVKEAGMKLSVTLISGLGGKERWQEHAINSAKVLSQMNPEYLGLLTLRAEGNAPLVKDIEEGRFKMLGPEEIMLETKLLLENINSPGTIFRSNHISNYVNLAGTLNKDSKALIETIDKALVNTSIFKSEEERYWDVNNL